jgi:hypothetical protein
MMHFSGIQKTFSYLQKNYGSCDEIFPLLCPVREKDWIDGWQYRMIHSHSGLIEQDCVFATLHRTDLESIWQVTHYDRSNYFIEFLRITPAENVVKIHIQLQPIDEQLTQTHIKYQYTALNEQQNVYIETELEKDFNGNMKYWEQAINYYLKTGLMLKRT